MYPEIKAISEQIRQLRIKRGLTQQELAERSNLSLPFINRLENNPKNISIETLMKILGTLDISLSNFFLPFSDDIDQATQELLIMIRTNKHKEAITECILKLLKIVDM